ncbi:MAG: hypothetical protein KC561_21380, partial [Myxococcales bacterium]|nr:hypothetical protein [Myxococcales bacterium]
FELARRVGSEGPEVALRLAEEFEIQDNFEAMADLLVEAYGLAVSNGRQQSLDFFYITAAEVLARLGRWEVLSDFNARFLADSADQSKALAAIARLYLDAGRYPDASAYVTQLERSFPRHVDLLELNVRLATERDGATAGWQVLDRRATGLTPWEFYADYFSRRGAPAVACAAMQRALETGPNQNYRLMAASYAVRIGDLEMARAIVPDFMGDIATRTLVPALVPGDSALRALVESLEQSGNLELAFRVAERAAELSDTPSP